MMPGMGYPVSAMPGQPIPGIPGQPIGSGQGRGLSRGRPRGPMRGRGAGPRGSESIVSFEKLNEMFLPNDKKNYIGESIYSKLQDRYGDNTGKITGMLLELSENDLMNALKSYEALSRKAEEAHDVLLKHLAQQTN